VWVSYFVLMLAIGSYAWRKSTASNPEYLLGGRDLPPAVAALSAGASDMSGWLSLTWPRMSGSGAVAGLVVGAATVILWILLGWNASYEIGEYRPLGAE
jgi:SSS family solute:Na+ symporter